VNTLASFSLLSWRNVIIEFREAPCLLHQSLFTETSALAVLPSRRIDGRARIAVFRHKQPGLIMHAPVFIRTLTVETNGIPPRYIFRFQFSSFHIRYIFVVHRIIANLMAKIRIKIETRKNIR
jgi:hypothetical protein